MVASVLQEVVADAAGAATSIAAPSLTAAGLTYLHVGISFGDGATGTVSSVTSVPSLTWTVIGSVVRDAGNGQSITHYKSSATAAGGVVVTANLSGSFTDRGIVVKEIGGSDGNVVGNAGQLQATPTTTTDATTSGNTGTLTEAPALLSGICIASGGAGQPAAGTGFTSDGVGWTFGGGTNLMRSESKRNTTTAAAAATFTAAANSSHMSLVAAWGEAASGSPPVPVMPLSLRAASGALAMGIVAPTQVVPSGPSGNTFSDTVPESIAFADSQSVTAQFAVTEAESITFTDAQTARVDFSVAEAESITFTDAQTGSAQFTVQRDESITFTDAQTGGTSYANVQRDESIAFTDSQTGVATFAGTTAESIAFTDAQTVQATFAVTEAESIAFTDSQTGIAVFVVQRDEAIAFSDSQDATIIAGGSSETDEAIAFTAAQSAQVDFSAVVAESIAFTAQQTSTTPPVLDALSGGTYGLWDFAEKRRKKKPEEYPPPIVEDLARAVAENEPPQRTKRATKAVKFDDLSMGALAMARAREQLERVAQQKQQDDEDDIDFLLTLL